MKGLFWFCHSRTNNSTQTFATINPIQCLCNPEIMRRILSGISLSLMQPYVQPHRLMQSSYWLKRGEIFIGIWLWRRSRILLIPFPHQCPWQEGTPAHSSRWDTGIFWETRNRSRSGWESLSQLSPWEDCGRVNQPTLRGFIIRPGRGAMRHTCQGFPNLHHSFLFLLRNV